MFKAEINRLKDEITQHESEALKAKHALKETGRKIGGVYSAICRWNRSLDQCKSTIVELELKIQDLSEEMRHNEDNQENISLQSELQSNLASQQTHQHNIESKITEKNNKVASLREEQSRLDNQETNAYYEFERKKGLVNELKISQEIHAREEEASSSYSYSS